MKRTLDPGEVGPVGSSGLQQGSDSGGFPALPGCHRVTDCIYVAARASYEGAADEARSDYNMQVARK